MQESTPSPEPPTQTLTTDSLPPTLTDSVIWKQTDTQDSRVGLHSHCYVDLDLDLGYTLHRNRVLHNMVPGILRSIA